MCVVTMPPIKSNLTPSERKNDSKLPLLLSNLKKAFGENIKGPIVKRVREYQASVKKSFIIDIVKFLSFRGVTKLSSITAWETEKNITIAYHFITQLGNEFLDSKITIITFVSKNVRKIKSIKNIFPIARIHEEDIEKDLKITFGN